MIRGCCSLIMKYNFGDFRPPPPQRVKKLPQLILGVLHRYYVRRSMDVRPKHIRSGLTLARLRILRVKVEDDRMYPNRSKVAEQMSK